jgi:hypothetical protein
MQPPARIVTELLGSTGAHMFAFGYGCLYTCIPSCCRIPSCLLKCILLSSLLSISYKCCNMYDSIEFPSSNSSYSNLMQQLPATARRDTHAAEPQFDRARLQVTWYIDKKSQERLLVLVLSSRIVPKLTVSSLKFDAHDESTRVDRKSSAGPKNPAIQHE